LTRSTTRGLIEAARSGEPAARDEFALLYQEPVRAYLLERWRGREFASEVDDALQEVFVECLRSGGALERFDAGRDGGFRAFLFGVARNICRRVETREPPGAGGRSTESALDDVEARDEHLSVVFDRAWARTLVRAAAKLQQVQADVLGAEALRRVEILRLRFRENLPVRAIAQRMDLDPVLAHREYARAREEVREALIEVVQLQNPRSHALAEAECEEILALLG
jgi:RNA polymerase sigma-70 factor (ECF subfamily)